MTSPTQPQAPQAPQAPTVPHAFIPHLCCDGAADAIAFYQRAFGAELLMQLPAPDGRLMHAMLRIGQALFMLNDEFPEHGGASPKRLGGSAVTLHRFVPDVDAAWAQALAAGCTVRMPLADMFWGDRYGALTCPWGHHWSLATPQRQLSGEQILQAMRAAG